MCKYPIKMWIDGKCFNIQKLQNNIYKKNLNSVYSEENSYEITIVESGKFQSSFELPRYYHSALTNYSKKGTSFYQIVHEQTTAKVVVPIHNNDNVITIIGNNKVAVVTARHIVHSILGELRERQAASQFVSIPIKSALIQNNFEKFKEEVLEQKLCGIDESIFMKTKRLHLTIACFVLISTLEKNEAVKTLEECKKHIIEPVIQQNGALKVNIFGVNCMGNKPEKEHILYANVKLLNDSNVHTLQSIANGISNFFYEKGFVRKYQSNVKLHMTLINTKYRRNGNKRKKRWTKEPFDARLILEKYKDMQFGECEINNIDLCLMQCDDDGFYKVMASISF